MRCQVYFVDLEGVHDGRALKNILPHVNPRRIVSSHPHFSVDIANVSGRYLFKPLHLPLIPYLMHASLSDL
jgi:hypothetical protein